MEHIITVIITAYKRKDYVRDAIDSIANQALDSSKFEVLYISDFSDYDNYIISKLKNIKIIKPKYDNWGEWIYEAVLQANGEIITFLDDDDIYSVYRLEHLYESINNSKYYNGTDMFFSNNYKFILDRKNLDKNIIYKP